jgi:O-antigen ligase
MPGLTRLLTLSPKTTTGVQRQQLWAGTVTLLSAHPLRTLIGYGPETLAQVYGPYYPPGLAEFEPDGQVRFPDRAHNLVLDIIAFTGMPGLVALLALWGGGFAMVFRTLGLSARRPLASRGVGLTAGATIGWAIQPTGALVGLGATLGGVGALLIGLVLVRRSEARLITTNEKRWLGAAVCAMLVAHGVETAFGFPTTSSALLFWLGLALATGLSAPETEDTEDQVARSAALLPLLGGFLNQMNQPHNLNFYIFLWICLLFYQRNH